MKSAAQMNNGPHNESARIQLMAFESKDNTPKEAVLRVEIIVSLRWKMTQPYTSMAAELRPSGTG